MVFGTNPLEKKLEVGGNSLVLGEIASDMILYLSALQNGQNKKETYQKSIEDEASLFEKAELFLYDLPTAKVRSVNLLNETESDFVMNNFSRDKETLSRLRNIAGLIKYNVNPTPKDIEMLKAFCERQLAYASARIK
ncbi:MAG: hypothetical protein AABW51_03680 [Nanoarchaeota archaeon]